MQSEGKGGKMVPVNEHWVTCPGCRKNKKLLKIRPDTEARSLVIYCRGCKREIVLDIDKGESVKRHGQ